MEKINVKELNDNVFETIGKEWMLVCAGGQSDDCANWTDHWYACRFWYVSDCICNKYVTNY